MDNNIRVNREYENSKVKLGSSWDKDVFWYKSKNTISLKTWFSNKVELKQQWERFNSSPFLKIPSTYIYSLTLLTRYIVELTSLHATCRVIFLTRCVSSFIFYKLRVELYSLHAACRVIFFTRCVSSYIFYKLRVELYFLQAVCRVIFFTSCVSSYIPYTDYTLHGWRKASLPLSMLTGLLLGMQTSCAHNWFHLSNSKVIFKF